MIYRIFLIALILADGLDFICGLKDFILFGMIWEEYSA